MKALNKEFRREFPKKIGHKFQTGQNYSGSKSKEAFKEIRYKFQTRKRICQ